MYQKLMNCDCMAMLASLNRTKVGMVLTDPMNTKEEGFNRQWLAKCHEILKEGRFLCTWSSPESRSAFISQAEDIGFKLLQTVTTVYEGWYDYPILVFSKGKPSKGFILFKEPPDIVDKNPIDGFPENSQKSVQLLVALIKHFTRKGDTVVDPFMGSGTTPYACALTDRNSVCSESYEPYYNVALKRMEGLDAANNNDSLK